VLLRRIGLAVVFSVCFLTAPLVAETQQSGKAYRVGWLAPAPIPENLHAFRNGLRALGYVDGDNLIIEQRYAGTKPLGTAATELLAIRPDVIVTDGSVAATAVKATAALIPVVFVSGDPVGMGLVPSLSRPGGNLTGLALISKDLNVKRLELLKETFPWMSHLGVLYEPRHADRMIPAIEAGARALSLSLTRLEVRGVDDIERAFTVAIRKRVDTIIPVSSALFDAEKQRLITLAAKHRLPTMYEHRPFSEAGGLMSYGPDIQDVFRRAATYVDKILKGAKPADLPVEQATKFELVINLKTAKTLGLTIPQSVLVRADEIIE
jgi:putative tryptophan/tyrosine transport system substrate-binding protein